ncbi:hypothetical protein LCGC14_2613960 [marine sediment metagenome]|uniref:Uncharacterized protein n=1 Tax=marine sediment metagenome TaxID=412755 RepID=A0A0F9ASQ3_9ZZZZ
MVDFIETFSDEYIMKEYKEAALKAITQYKHMIKVFEEHLQLIETERGLKK